MKGKISILITQNDTSYHFAEVLVTSDGSLEIAFPTIKENTGIVQSIQVSEQAYNPIPVLLNNDVVPINGATQYYISYHTSGMVNYHGMTFRSAFMEPLYEVHSKNIFFIYSFVYPDAAFRNCDNKDHANAVNIDISSLTERRINIVLSICPLNYNLEHMNSFVIKYPLYSLCVEIVEDNVSFNFSQIYGETDCVKLRPHLDKFSEQSVTKEYAFLSYNHALYQTNEAIVFPPNGEGNLKIVFSVEMRIPPWLYIEFADPNFSAEVVTRKTTYLTFKVIDKKHNQYIKRAEDIKITQLILDANIYEDDSFVPPGCI